MKPLDERHRRAAAALATGTAADTSAAVGVSVRSIQEWKKREDFAALVTELRDREASHEPGALATLRELLASPDEAIRLRAATALINAGRGGHDPVDDDSAPPIEFNEDALDGDGPEAPDFMPLYDAWDEERRAEEAADAAAAAPAAPEAG